MTKSKKLMLYSVLLGAYSSSNICMEKQTEQIFNFNALPFNVQEQIIGYLPADNLYRTLWSRHHNASPEFYNDIVKAYLESHFVSQEFIHKILAKDFCIFKGSKKERREFQEKVKKALQCYSQQDTKLFSKLIQRVSAHSNRFDVPFNAQMTFGEKLELAFLIRHIKNKNECITLLKDLKEVGKLTQAKKRLQKLSSCVKRFRAWLPLTYHKALFIRLLHTLVTPYDGLLMQLALLLPIDCFILSIYKPAYIYLDERTSKQTFNFLVFGLFIIYCTVINNLIAHCLDYARDRLESSFGRYLLVCANKLEELQAKIVQVLDVIDQLEKA